MMSIEKLIKEKDFHIVYQPVLDIGSNHPFAYEALVRAHPEEFRNPLNLIQKAVEVNLMGELGQAIRQMTIDLCPDAPLFINVHPVELEQGWLIRPNDAIFMHEHPIYLEITESVPLSHFQTCQHILKELKNKGMFLAIDDLGSGYSNLKYIADLEPDVVKLDLELIRDIHLNRRQHALVKSIVSLCHNLDARVVAEGIETVEEMHAVRECGADFGQGYFIARPAFPLPEVRKIGLAPPVM